MHKEQLEVRSLGNLELRQEGDSRRIEGQAIVFDSPSVDMGFTEIIKRGAITQELLDSSDIFLNFNHDDSRILGRSNCGKGSLNVELREDCVYFSIEAPETSLGDEVLAYLKRGDVNKCSFCFWMSGNDEDETWSKSEDGTITRTINHIAGLHDLSIVWNPAYDQTTVSARSLEKLNELREKKEDEPKNEDEPQKCESKKEDEPQKCESNSEDKPNEESKKCESKSEDEPKDDDPDNDMDDTDDDKDDTDNPEDNPDDKEVDPDKDKDEDHKDKETK